MRLRLFRAPNMAEAMARVRAELGDDALILGTRPVQEGVEITAALESAASVAPAARPPVVPDPRRADLLAFHAVPATLRPALADGPLDQALRRALPFHRLALTGDARPLLLVGTPGAGKTLTVARLATRLVLAGCAPMVITADAKRAGATEQLAAFTRLLGLTLTVASHPVTVGRALARRPPGAPVLIDCPGTDAFDPTQMEELRALAAAADGSIALVLPAGLQVEEAADLAQAHAANGAEMLVATRLDLARRFGGLLAAAAAASLPLAEAGIGPGAADGLVPLTPEELARRMEARLAPSAAAAGGVADRLPRPAPTAAPRHHGPPPRREVDAHPTAAPTSHPMPPPASWQAAAMPDPRAPLHAGQAASVRPRPTPMPAPRARQDVRHAE